MDLQSKSGQPLARYFPELVQALRALPAPTFVVDAKIVIPRDGGFSFDALLRRIHPAPSRVRRLAVEHPARLMLFDLLVEDGRASLVHRALRDRRRALEAFAGAFLSSGGWCASPPQPGGSPRPSRNAAGIPAPPLRRDM